MDEDACTRVNSYDGVGVKTSNYDGVRVWMNGHYDEVRVWMKMRK